MNKQGTFIAKLIDSAPRAYAVGAVERQQELLGDRFAALTEHCFVDPVTDAMTRLMHLGEALAAGRPALLHDYLSWTKIAHVARGGRDELIVSSLQGLAAELRERLPAEGGELAAGALEDGIAHYESAATVSRSLLEDDAPYVELATRLLVALLEARSHDAVAMINEAAEGGASYPDLMRHVVLKAQSEIGRLWQVGDLDVGEEHVASRIVESVLHELARRIPPPAPDARRVLVSCVAGDAHGMGARVVADHFAHGGFFPVLLGADVPASSMAITAREMRVDVIALSAHLTLHVRTTAGQIASLRSDLEGATTPIIVGGGPFRVVHDLWEVVGADGGVLEAEDAPVLAAELLADPDLG